MGPAGLRAGRGCAGTDREAGHRRARVPPSQGLPCRAARNLSTDTRLQGAHPLIDSYSVFAMNHYVQFTELPRLLFSRGITKVTIVGLAMDWCVKASVCLSRAPRSPSDASLAGHRRAEVPIGCRRDPCGHSCRRPGRSRRDDGRTRALGLPDHLSARTARLSLDTSICLHSPIRRHVGPIAPRATDPAPPRSLPRPIHCARRPAAASFGRVERQSGRVGR
jgi:hypothetical protein